MHTIVVGVAQSDRALGCGPRGRGFKSHHSPHQDHNGLVRLLTAAWLSSRIFYINSPIRVKYFSLASPSAFLPE
jgi:hypothetical protein